MTDSLLEDEESFIKGDIEADIGEPEKIWIGSINCPGRMAHMLPNTLRWFASEIERQMRDTGWDVDDADYHQL